MMIAVASMTNKPLIIVDEPTSALDSALRKEFLPFYGIKPERNRRTGGIARHGFRQRMRQTYNNVINLIKIKP